MVAGSGQIVVNGRFLQRAVTGVDRFAFETLFALDQLIGAGALPALPLMIAVPPGTKPSVGFKHIPIQHVGSRQGHLWEQLDLPLFCGGRRLVNLCNTAPMAKRNQLVVIHDATTRKVPEAFSKAFRAWYGVLLPIIGRRSDTVATISQFSRKEIASTFGIPKEKIAVLPEGAEHILRYAPDTSILAKSRLGQRPYFLAVSTVVPHKNFRLILEALRMLGDVDFDIAIAGGSNPKVFGDAGLAEHPNVRWLGYVSNEQLRALYENAAGFLFPSLYEGFGLPPIEAMCCACPVIVSNAASMPEVCGEAALYIDPRSAQSLADAMRQLLASPELARKLRDSGRERARQWTWERAARELVALIENTDRSPGLVNKELKA